MKPHFLAVGFRNPLELLSFRSEALLKFRNACNYLLICLSSICWLNPPKQGLFQSKHGSLGFQVYIYIYI